MGPFQLGLRRITAQLSRSSIVSGQCLRQQKFTPPSSSIVELARSSSFTRSYATAKKSLPAGAISRKMATATAATPIAIPKDAKTESPPKSSSFPETNSKVVGYWLIGSAVSVFGIVVWGGLTRLTESGYVFLDCLSRFVAWLYGWVLNKSHSQSAG